MKISVITVCYNSSSTIDDTLSSIVSQDFKDKEIIVIDGNSQDQTVQICESYSAHISHLVSEADDGLFHAMNKGIKLATGDVIGFLNSDDVFADEFVLSTIAKELSAKGKNIFFSDLLYVEKNLITPVRHWKTGQYVKGAFYSGWCPPHPTFYVKSEVIEEFGGFNLSYKFAADFDWMYRILENSPNACVYVPRVLVKMRVGGQSNRNVSNIFRQNCEIMKIFFRQGKIVNPLSFFIQKLRVKSREYLNARKLGFNQRS